MTNEILKLARHFRQPIQQDLQALHRMRRLLVGRCTAIINRRCGHARPSEILQGTDHACWNVPHLDLLPKVIALRVDDHALEPASL